MKKVENIVSSDADEYPIADNADDETRYFNPDWSEEEIDPNFLEMVKNRANNQEIVISETVNGEDFLNNQNSDVGVNFPATEIENEDCEAMDHSSTGSTGCIRLGGEGETQYNPIDVNAPEDFANG